MKILDFLCVKAMSADLKSTTKTEMIAELIDLFIEANVVEKKHKKKIFEVLLAREALGSTAIGQGIAIPHGKSDCVNKLVGCLAVSKKGVNFDSLDGEPAHIFFMLISPMDAAGPHLKALAKISRLLQDKFIRDGLKTIKDEKSMLKLIQQEDARLAQV